MKLILILLIATVAVACICIPKQYGIKYHPPLGANMVSNQDSIMVLDSFLNIF